MAVLNLCAIGFCRRPYRVVELASKFRKAGLQGFRVMRIAGSMMLLMFDDDKMRHELLASGKLDEWLESVGTWSSMMLIHNRRTRLSISGLLIETDWRFHIDEDLELRVGEQCFPIRVTEIEEAIGPKCDCSCELMEESEFSGKHDKKEDAKERIDASAVKGRDSGNNSVGSVVPNSISLKAMNSLERDEEVRYSDVPAECGLREEIQVRASEDVVVNNPTSRGPSNRITLAEVIEYRGQQRKVRQISEVLLSEIPPQKREVALNQISKRGRGRPKMKNTEANRIVNGSLSDSDFVNRKKVILREAEEVLQLGKLIGAETNGNEKAIVQDITRIIETRELRQ
ncbi:hypothetical protein V6N13_063576 [Hibiscus sabdariffa]